MRLTKNLITAITILLNTANALTAPPSASPNSKSEPKTWAITRLLTGTSSQIRDKLNSECERFMAKSKMMQKTIVELDERIAIEEKESVERARKSEGYLKAQAELREAQNRLAKVRDKGTPYQKIEEAGRVNTLKLTLAKIEKLAPQESPELKTLKQERQQRQDTIAKYQIALKESMKWRAEIIDATRNHFRIHAPVKIGSSGILGIVTPTKIIDDTSFLVIYRAAQPISIEDTKEGISTVNVLIKEVPLLLTGIETRQMRPNIPILLDKNFVLTDAKLVGDDIVYTASRKQSDVDELFATILDLREIELHEDIDLPTTLPIAETTQPAKR
jgi:hypothetical protein